MTHTLSSAAMERGDSRTSAPVADDYTFRAPRHGDLVVCPYCGPDTFTCDHCGGERRLYANEVFS